MHLKGSKKSVPFDGPARKLQFCSAGSYYLDTHHNKPGWRKLQVVVSRKDVEVSARAGFLVTNSSVDPEVTHKADVEFAMNSPFDSTGIEVTEQWL